MEQFSPGLVGLWREAHVGGRVNEKTKLSKCVYTSSPLETYS